MKVKKKVRFTDDVADLNEEPSIQSSIETKSSPPAQPLPDKTTRRDRLLLKEWTNQMKGEYRAYNQEERIQRINITVVAMNVLSPNAKQQLKALLIANPIKLVMDSKNRPVKNYLNEFIIKFNNSPLKIPEVVEISEVVKEFFIQVCKNNLIGIINTISKY